MVSVRPVLPRLLAGALALLVALPASAQTPRVPPVFDQLASPFTDSEVGGLGCMVASTAVGLGMISLMGGIPGLRLAVQGMITPRTVLEASAAGAFVFSSTCYIGQAVAPVILLGYTALLDSLTEPVTHPAPPSRTGTSGAVSWMTGGGMTGGGMTGAGQGSGAPLP